MRKKAPPEKTRQDQKLTYLKDKGHTEEAKLIAELLEQIKDTPLTQHDKFRVTLSKEFIEHLKAFLDAELHSEKSARKIPKA